MSVAEERTRYILGHIGRWPDGRWHFPTLASCLVCDGLTSIVRRHPETVRYEPEDALHIALVEHGYLLSEWHQAGANVANAFIVPKACTCGHLHQWENIIVHNRRADQVRSDAPLEPMRDLMCRALQVRCNACQRPLFEGCDPTNGVLAYQAHHCTVCNRVEGRRDSSD